MGYSKNACPQISKERDVVLNVAPNVVVDYCAGRLDAGRAAEFERHIAHCDACAAMVAAQREVWETLDRWGHVDSPEVSPDFDARLYARIAHEQADPAWKQWLRRIMRPATPGVIWKPALSMAAACAVLAIGLMVRMPKPVQHTAQMEADRADIRMDIHVDIEQVANTLDELDLLMPASQASPSAI